jgi:carboxypeptidase T
MMQMLYFMCDFLSKASPESEQMALLNSVDLYFVPFVNPDGYLYNESQKLSGNVFWRKNRRDNLDGSFGVDLNRNYDAYWGYDESGSSSDPSSDLYRGESAFSEPETQALKSLSEQLNPLGVLNFHSYGNYVLYSYAYQDGAYAKDDINLRSIAESITAENQYVYGTSWEVLYAVNGGADDWQYDRNFLSPTLSFTPEVGEAEEGFWPSEEKIIPYCKDNLFLNYEFVQRMTLLTDGIKEHSKQAIVYIQQGQLYSQTAGNIRLYSILGQELLNTNIQNGISLNLNAYKGQLVLVELINPQGKFTQKVYVN